MAVLCLHDATSYRLYRGAQNEVGRGGLETHLEQY